MLNVVNICNNDILQMLQNCKNVELIAVKCGKSLIYRINKFLVTCSPDYLITQTHQACSLY